MNELLFAFLLWLNNGVESSESTNDDQSVVQPYSNGGGCPGGICDDKKEDKKEVTSTQGNG